MMSKPNTPYTYNRRHTYVCVLFSEHLQNRHEQDLIVIRGTQTALEALDTYIGTGCPRIMRGIEIATH